MVLLRRRDPGALARESAKSWRGFLSSVRTLTCARYPTPMLSCSDFGKATATSSTNSFHGYQWGVPRYLERILGYRFLVTYQHLPKNTSDPFFKRTPWALCVTYVQSTAYSCSMVYKPQFLLLSLGVWLAPARSGSLRLRIAFFRCFRIFKICFRYGGYLRIFIHIQDAMSTPWRSMKASPPVVAEKQQ